MDKLKAKELIGILAATYPDADTELKFGDNFQLLVAVILSAQCTDKRVNTVTERLFKIASTPADFDDMPIEELERLIFSCGFYKNKAKNIKGTAKRLLEKFNGVVPDNLSDLRSLSGVGQKTANVVYAVGFKGDSIAVDTHVFRVSNRTGLVDCKNVFDTENALMKIIDKNMWSRAHHYILFHGRYTCKSRLPKCAECAVLHLCAYKNKNLGK
jgi:endonuclease-3